MTEVMELVHYWLDVCFSMGAVWVYLAIFAACFIENIFPPFPGDSFILAAGGLVAAGRLDAGLAFLAVNVGGLTSVMLIYLIARRFGRDYFMKRNYKYFSVQDILAVEKKLDRFGGGILVASRFVVGFRLALAVVAGIARYPIGKMLLYTALSYFAFAALVMYIGFALVENFDRIEGYFNSYNWIVWPLLGFAAAAWIYQRYKKLREGGD